MSLYIYMPHDYTKVNFFYRLCNSCLQLTVNIDQNTITRDLCITSTGAERTLPILYTLVACVLARYIVWQLFQHTWQNSIPRKKNFLDIVLAPTMHELRVPFSKLDEPSKSTVILVNLFCKIAKSFDICKINKDNCSACTFPSKMSKCVPIWDNIRI